MANPRFNVCLKLSARSLEPARSAESSGISWISLRSKHNVTGRVANLRFFNVCLKLSERSLGTYYVFVARQRKRHDFLSAIFWQLMSKMRKEQTKQSLRDAQACLATRRVAQRAKRSRETSEQREIRLERQRDYVNNKSAVMKQVKTDNLDRKRRSSEPPPDASMKRLNTEPGDLKLSMKPIDGAANNVLLSSKIAETKLNQRQEYLHNRRILRTPLCSHEQQWVQEELGALHRYEQHLHHLHCTVCKETWPLAASKVKAEKSYICRVADAAETRSRAVYSPPKMTWILV